MKKLLSMLLAAAMLCALLIPVSGTADPSPTRDADIFDALDVLKHVVGMVELSPIEKYDHNEDGVIDIFDALEVLKGLVGMRTAVQMPVCDCGDCNGCNNVDFQVVGYTMLWEGEKGGVIWSLEDLNAVISNNKGWDILALDIDESFFDDKAVIVLNKITSNMGSRPIIDSLIKSGDSIIIRSTTGMGYGEDFTTPFRIILSVNHSDLEDVNQWYGNPFTDTHISVSDVNAWLNNWLESKRLI
jgi:hypothetical protein